MSESLWKRIWHNKKKVFIYGGPVSIGTLLTFLVTLSFLGISVSTSGDIVCAGSDINPCVSQFNINVSNYTLCFGSTFKGVYFDEPEKIKDWELYINYEQESGRQYCTYGREYLEWQHVKDDLYYCSSPSKQDDFTTKYQRCEKLSESKKMCYRKGGEVKLPYKEFANKCLPIGNHDFDLIGYKFNPSDTVKWGTGYGLTEVDPLWKGIEENIIYTPSSETHCTNGKCWTALYSGTRFVYEDNVWKKMENARSLKNKGFNIVYLEDDKIHDFEVVDFNYTSITLIPTVKDSKELNKDIPLKMDEFILKNVRLTSLTSKVEQIIAVDNVLAHNYSFGENSTTIKLQTADTENLADIDAIDSSTDIDAQGQIKWNITPVPSGQTIEDATQCFWIERFYGIIDNDIQFWRVDDQTWTESISKTTYDSQTLTNQTLDTLSSITDDTWTCFNVTVVILTDYNIGNGNSSIRIHDPDSTWDGTAFAIEDENGISIGDISAGIYFRFEDRENSAKTGNLPYLNITYSEAGAPDINYTFGPAQTTRLLWDQNITGGYCGPDDTSYWVEPENQTSTYGIFKLCNNGTTSGDLKGKLSGTQNTGWIIMFGNSSSTSNAINMTTTYQTINSTFAENTCSYVWGFANCTTINQNPGVNIEFNIV